MATLSGLILAVCRSRFSHQPVSYTHLDVYKRQYVNNRNKVLSLMLMLVLVIGGQQNSSAGLFKKLVLIFNNKDVYKRQPCTCLIIVYIAIGICYSHLGIKRKFSVYFKECFLILYIFFMTGPSIFVCFE